MEGVEINESSRFVDHTVATPWEALLSEIEKELKSNMKAVTGNPGSAYENNLQYEFNYLGKSYNLVKQKVCTLPYEYQMGMTTNDLILNGNIWFPKTFHLQKNYLLFSPGSKTTEYEKSLRNTLLSALITAIHAVDFKGIPIFFAYPYVKDINHAKDIVGFYHHPDEKGLVNPYLFESITLDRLFNSKHTLYYLDGIRKIFEKKLTLLSERLRSSNFLITNMESDNYHVTNKTSFLYTKEDLSWLRKRNRIYYNQTTNGLFVSYFNQLLTQLNVFKSNINLNFLAIELQYPPQKQSMVIDNENYSTFIPSKQSPSAWSLLTSFSTDNESKKQDSTDTSSEIDRSLWMANVIRKLLALYICARYQMESLPPLNNTSSPSTNHSSSPFSSSSAASSKSNTAFNYGIAKIAEAETMDGLFDFHKIQLATEVLSEESRQEVQKICPSNVLVSEVVAATQSQDAYAYITNRVDGRAVMIPPPVYISSSKVINNENPVVILNPTPSTFEKEDHVSAARMVIENVGSVSFDNHDASPQISPFLHHNHPLPKTDSSSGTDAVNVVSPNKLSHPSELSNSMISGLSNPISAEYVELDNTDTLYMKQESAIMNFLHKNANMLDCFTSLFRPQNSTATKEVKGITPIYSDADILSLSQNSSIGHWMNLYSVLNGCIVGDIRSFARLWKDCLNELHYCWENDYPIKSFTTLGRDSHELSDISTPTSTFIGNAQHGNVHVESKEVISSWAELLFINPNLLNTTPSSPESKQEKELSRCIYNDPLWNDLLEKKKREGIVIDLPNLSDSTIIQNLQLLQFCIVMKKESPIYSFPPNPSSRIPATIYPDLFRRCPVTHDALALQEQLRVKIRSGSSKSVKEFPFLKWQILMPTLIADIKAFKGSNKQGTLDQFTQWYGVNREETSDINKATEICEAIEEIWDQIEGQSCRNAGQKPLFQPEKEVENSLRYLKKITLLELSMEMLERAMKFFYYILLMKLKYFCASPDVLSLHSKSVTTSRSPSTRSSTPHTSHHIYTDMSVLQEQIQRVLTQFYQDRNQESSRHRDPTLNTFMLIDSIVGLIDILEQFIIKSENLEEIFMNSHNAVPVADEICEDIHVSVPGNNIKKRYTCLDSHDMEQMIHEISKYDSNQSYNLRNEQQIASVFQLIQSIGKKEKSLPTSHEWHSFDGRELGLPSIKEFKFFMNPSLLGVEKKSVQESDEVLNNQKVLFEMHAIVKDSQLRISTISPEAI